MDTPVATPPFWTRDDGPFERLLRRLRLARPGGAVRIAALVAITWLPLVAGAAVRRIFGHAPEPLVYDISVHVRFLITLPLVLVAEQMLHRLCRASIDQLYDGKFADVGLTDRVLGRAERLRTAPSIELALAAVAVVVGQLVLWGVVGKTGLVSGATRASWSPSGIWYAAVALPVLQFLILRWLWRWAIWSLVLARLSRVRLATQATHPDHAAGLEFLSWPIGAFTMLLLALACILAAAWGTQLATHRTTLSSLMPTLAILLAVALLVGLGPLLLFSRQLYRARLDELGDFNGFSLRYVREFHAKWIDAVPVTSALGAADIQALRDLGGAYAVIVTTRLVVFSRRQVLAVLLAVLLPLLPLAATSVPIQRVFSHLGTVLLGALSV